MHASNPNSTDTWLWILKKISRYFLTSPTWDTDRPRYEGGWALLFSIDKEKHHVSIVSLWTWVPCERLMLFPEGWRDCEEGGKGKQETDTTFRFQRILLNFSFFLSFFFFLGKWNWFLQQNCDCQSESAHDFLHWLYHKWHLHTFHHFYVICEFLPRSTDNNPELRHI